MDLYLHRKNKVQDFAAVLVVRMIEQHFFRIQIQPKRYSLQFHVLVDSCKFENLAH